jgi:hypothetical protein
MAKFEDYLPGGQRDPNGGIEKEIEDAQQQQQARIDDATPAVNWEERYKELEKLNSRQAQTLGEYRQTIDTFITNPTPTETKPEPTEVPPTISVDDFYEDPNAAVLKAVESHPAIQEARALKDEVERNRRQAELNAFTERHGDYQEIGTTPEFQNWVVDNPTRLDLFQRGNNYDFNAADALFSLYKAERGLTQVSQEASIAQDELVSSSGELPPREPPQYSRSEYIRTLTRSKQGDLEAEDWVKAHSANYRRALASGNVRD